MPQSHEAHKYLASSEMQKDRSLLKRKHCSCSGACGLGMRASSSIIGYYLFARGHYISVQKCDSTGGLLANPDCTGTVISNIIRSYSGAKAMIPTLAQPMFLVTCHSKKQIGIVTVLNLQSQCLFE